MPQYNGRVEAKTPGGFVLSIKSKDILKFAFLLLGTTKSQVMNTALELYADKFDLYGAATRFGNSKRMVNGLYEGSEQDQAGVSSLPFRPS